MANQYSIAGLIFDDSPHYLDHLAPLCSLLNIPLALHEPSLIEQAESYYSEVKLIHSIPNKVISCYTLPLLEAAFPTRTFHNIWLPHGNSDKNLTAFSLLENEKAALFYGQQMKSRAPFTSHHIVGNFRLEYHLRHRKTLPLPKGPNFLYAPTWDNTSFWNAFAHLATNLPKDTNLLIKLHPNTLKKYAPEIEREKGRFKNKNILFLPDYPIYPLLEACDAYIGDMSSIGYDFLYFERPMFFLNAQNLPLHECGDSIDPQTFHYPLNNPYKEKQRALYLHAFSPCNLPGIHA